MTARFHGVEVDQNTLGHGSLNGRSTSGKPHAASLFGRKIGGKEIKVEAPA
jgi:hypothetical protein